MPDSSSVVTLPDILEILQRDYEGNVSYPRVWALAVSRKIRVQKFGREYRLDPAQVPAIAAALDLTPRVAEAA